MRFTKTFAIAACIAALISSQGYAQDTEASVETADAAVTEAAEKLVANTEDGVLKGKVFVDADGVEKPVNANVTLSSDGVVVDAVEADENGDFSFEGIEPGSYQLLGSSDGYIGGQAYDVQPYAGDVGGCSSCNLGLQSVEVPYSEEVYAAPASACGSSCGSCGGGGGGGGLFSGGGGGGGLLGNRRLLALGAAGGIIAVAVSDDDDDNDASPTN